MGYSAHSLVEIRDKHADYYTLSPIFHTDKEYEVKPLGPVDVSPLGREVYALGGITSENASRLAGLGYTGVAAYHFIKNWSCSALSAYLDKCRQLILDVFQRYYVGGYRVKVLVTGTAGFIGFHLAENCSRGGDTVVGIDNINDYYDIDLKYGRLAESGIERDAVTDNKAIRSSIHPEYIFIKMGIEDKEGGVEDLFAKEKFDAVVNLAAQAGVRYSLKNPHAYVTSNMAGFMNILEGGCRHNDVKHLVYASSSSVYGLNESQPFATTDNIDHPPISLYAASKKS